MCATMPAYSVRYVICSFLIFFAWKLNFHGYSIFITLILRGMGWSVTASLLLVRNYGPAFDWLTDLDCRAHLLMFSRSDLFPSLQHHEMWLMLIYLGRKYHVLRLVVR